MIVYPHISTLLESRIRIRARVVLSSTGDGASRRVILQDSARAYLGETTSAADGSLMIERNGNANDRYVLQAVGRDGECDAISCDITGEAI